MKPDLAAIQANAVRLSELHGRIYETLSNRSTSAAGRAAWEAACAEFHSSFNDLFFPSGLAGWQSFVDRTPEGVELAIDFLEADPIVFRSGYLKEIVWHKLKQIWLTPEEKGRLERVANAYLTTRLRREFWSMARFVRLRGSLEFWQQIEQLGSSPVRSEQAVRAGWLLLARRNFPVRSQLGYEMFRPKWEAGAVPQRDLWLQQHVA